MVEKTYIVKKTVKAKSIREALDKEKEVEPDDVYEEQQEKKAGF